MPEILTPDVFASPALPLLLDLDRLGCRVELTPHGTIAVEPASRLTTEQQAAFRAHARELALLVRCLDPGVLERRDVMRQQIEQPPAGCVLPALLFRQDVPYVTGRCFSCGDELQQYRVGRCWRCALAWRLAAHVPISSALADALDSARVA